MLISSSVIVVLTSFLVIHFDGSLRVPPDLYPDTVPSSMSSSFLSPVATCAAALFSSDGSLLAIGGSRLDLFPTTTSAAVEYEGLIYGLRELSQLLSDPSFIRHNGSPRTDPIDVVVRGDCKTVIDQMNGKAKPRKQRLQYNEAQSLVKELSEKYLCSCTFEHVNRDENTICDRACQKIMKDIQVNEINSLCNMIEHITASNRPLACLPRSKKKRLHFRNTHLSQPLALLSDWNGGWIPLSIRPYLLSEIAFAANQMNDFVALRIVGETLLSESERWTRFQLISRQLESNDLKNIAKQSLFTGLMGMGLKKEALLYIEDEFALCDLDCKSWIQKFKTIVPSYSEKVMQYMDCSGVNVGCKKWDLSDVTLGDDISLR